MRCMNCGCPLHPQDTQCRECGMWVQRKSGMGAGMIILIVVGVLFGGCILLGVIGSMMENPARKGGNEASAVGALKTMSNSQSLFREGDKDGDEVLDYGSLKELSDQQLIDGILGSGTKQGYVFECKPSKSTPEFMWMATASPQVPGTTGDRYFMTNHEGVTYYRNDRPFKITDDCKVPPDAVPVGR